MIRVRFAPSPTGFLHIGGLRTYFYNWLFAKKNKGKIILRIEDTDRQRFIKGAAENLIQTLKNIGLGWDEGPYFQSRRIKTYRDLAQKLVGQDKAYYCFCPEEKLKKMKQKQIEQKMPPCYDRTCRKLNKKEVNLQLRSGRPYVIRLKVPEWGSISFKDLIHGQVKFDLKNIDDQILLKSDGWPTYHLANVVDDHSMKITHIIRGEEWLPSVPKHLLIYQAFGWQPPEFAHLPLLLNHDRSKLSKRQGDVAVEEYLSKGYLPEALLNFIVLLGWNPGTDQEIFSLKELTKRFSLEKIQKTGAIFDRKKLDWLNGYYLRQMAIANLTKKCLPYLVCHGSIKSLEQLKFKIQKTGEVVDCEWIQKIIALAQERLRRLDEISELTEFFFINQPDYNPKELLWGKTTKEQIKNNLKRIKDLLGEIRSPDFKIKKITKILMQLAQKQGAGEIFWPLRVALTGRQASPPPAEIAEILGKKKVLDRINQAIKKLENN